MHGLALKDTSNDSLRALECILEAWEDGTEQGIPPEMLAYAALYAALTDLVGSFGETHVSTLVDGLRGRILGGEFTMRGRNN